MKQKTSPLSIVHAFATENELLLGQRANEEKSNELARLPGVLKVIAARGNTITIEAMGCQKEIVQQVTTLGGDYPKFPANLAR